MSDNNREPLSALMDAETNDFETRRLLQDLDEEGVAAWSRYHLARSALKAEPITAPADLASRVSRALNEEPEHHVSGFRARALKPVASVGVAASVTAMVIFGAQSLQTAPESPPAQTASSLTLPGPNPLSAGLMPAQYGNGGSGHQVRLGDDEVIRLSSEMLGYIDRHESLLESDGPAWRAGWVPDGFTPVRQDRVGNSQVMMFSNGRTTLSVSVEPLKHQGSKAGVVQKGETIALGRAVDNRFVTVVGDIPLMIADRIAASVDTAAGEAAAR